MAVGDDGDCRERDQRILDALERDLHGIRIPGTPPTPSVPDGAMGATWPALAGSVLLLLGAAALLVAAVRLGSSLFTFGALALFPFVLMPVILSGRASRGISTRRRSGC